MITPAHEILLVEQLQACTGKIRRRPNGDDIVQETSLRCKKQERVLDWSREHRGYLLKAAGHTTVDLIRRAATRKFATLPSDIERNSPGDDPLSTASRQEGASLLLQQIDRLPAGRRRALLARYVDGLTWDKIASELGVSVKTAQRWCEEAREYLRKAPALSSYADGTFTV